jgi:hypothetical protein
MTREMDLCVKSLMNIMSTTPMVVCAFDAYNTTTIFQMSDRAVCTVDSHVYLGCAVHGLRAEAMCALKESTHNPPRGYLAG